MLFTVLQDGKFIITILIILIINSCSFRHIGCLGMYKGEQVKLLKYIGKGEYIVCPENDTTIVFIIDSKDLD